MVAPNAWGPRFARRFLRRGPSAYSLGVFFWNLTKGGRKWTLLLCPGRSLRRELSFHPYQEIL